MSKKPVFVFISGGVISGIGKGIITASIALLLKEAGFKVCVNKLDMYLNVDAGTMNPLEHGEVFVTADGVETDQDLGHYERFLKENLSRKNYMTAGQIYLEVIQKERKLGFEGQCVDAYYQIPQQVIKHWEELGKDKDFVLIEMGGTVGEYQNVLFFEAARRLRIKYPSLVFFVHVVYLPTPGFLGEMKSKPAQQSIVALNSLGIFPDLIICRGEFELDEKRKQKIALAAALPVERIFSAPDVKFIYEVPLVLEKQRFEDTFLQMVGFKKRKKNLKVWSQKVEGVKNIKKELPVAIVGKYQKSGSFSLDDAYVSVVEAIKHACWFFGFQPKIVWVDSGSLTEEKIKEIFQNIKAIIVPGGFGTRGVEGKIKAIQFARENKIPFLGLCFGMQLAVVEFARNVLGWQQANSTEIDPKTKFPVIHLMSEQEKKLLKKDYGGTMRLGNWPCKLKDGTNSFKVYQKFGWLKEGGKPKIEERHRHRFEFNNLYLKEFEKKGLVIAGTTPDEKLVEIIELPKNKHPYFVGVQFHPEFLSCLLRPHPLFLGLMENALKGGE